MEELMMMGLAIESDNSLEEYMNETGETRISLGLPEETIEIKEVVEVEEVEKVVTNVNEIDWDAIFA